MAVIKEIVFDCQATPALARFWAALLDGYAVRAYDDEEVARLAKLGLTPDTDPIRSSWSTVPAPVFASSRCPAAITETIVSIST